MAGWLDRFINRGDKWVVSEYSGLDRWMHELVCGWTNAQMFKLGKWMSGQVNGSI